jgi:hypothetical protein
MKQNKYYSNNYCYSLEAATSLNKLLNLVAICEFISLFCFIKQFLMNLELQYKAVSCSFKWIKHAMFCNVGPFNKMAVHFRLFAWCSGNNRYCCAVSEGSNPSGNYSFWGDSGPVAPTI